ncbi:iron dicitrate transport regulator FecR [Pedobacter sp. HMWF019]|uniref:FecR family protein n=1 Tax=Pedobacter sp. HMWF019 TaxID=2056856 RepID=UPI000D38CB8F|nr:FecR family protein [Pedobacter sp. HMWF019]PTS94195.1 iron dicitrate transport regulator FecR [Pedobacter sp. HMWF019]
MKTEKSLRQLFDQYVKGTSSPEEKNAFFVLVNDPAHQDTVQELMEEYLLQGNFVNGLEADRKQDILQHIFSADENVVLADKKSSRRIVSMWTSWISVAAAVCIVFTGVYIVRKHTEKVTYTQYNGELAPGGNKATLVLADGRKVSLTDAANGKLAEQAGVSIRKTADGQLVYETGSPAVEDHKVRYNTISTPAGGEYQVVLPDGTHVWLNAASSLKYPVSFASLRERRVELKGEAYFEVSKLRVGEVRLPFTVTSDKQEVEVLGTHFNINSYEESDGVETTLLEGSVKVSRAGVFEKTIVPGEQSRVSDNIKVFKVDTANAVAWKNGLFKFDNASISIVMSQLSRWYDVDVEYVGNIPGNKFNGEIYRNMNASKAFKILSLANINFRVEAPNKGTARKKIIITGN